MSARDFTCLSKILFNPVISPHNLSIRLSTPVTFLVSWLQRINLLRTSFSNVSCSSLIMVKFAEELGIGHYYAETLPDQKAELIKVLQPLRPIRRRL